MNRRAMMITILAVVFSPALAVRLAASDVAPKAAAAAPAAPAAESAKEDPAHNELRALRKNMVDAIAKGDVNKLATYLDPDVVVTWENGEVSRKPAGVKAYWDRMMKGPGHVVDRYTADPTVDELTHLYGNTGVAFGSSNDHFQLADGKELNLHTRWTATVVKKAGQWKVAAFHASVNMFDNALLRMAVVRTAWWVGGIAAVVGLVVGAAVVLIFRKRSTAGAAPAR